MSAELEYADQMVENHGAAQAEESGFLSRKFSTELTEGAGRTVDVRIVPYGETAEAADGFGGVPKGVAYREEWMPGAFDGQMRAAHRVLLNFEHQQGIAGVIGKGLELREAADGLHGSFKLLDSPDGDKALLLVREGVLAGVSLEAYAKKSVRTAAGVVRRVKAHLRNVALCREPAFAGAVVLAIREQQFVLDEELLPVQPDLEVVERCRRLGIPIPAALKAHPAEADTPAETGTSESGTRQEPEEILTES
jgi:Escherichia/Staphylococcus phage prohead protease